MKGCLGVEKLYVITDDRKIYEVNEYQTYDNRKYISYNLDLLAGYDYINEDSDVEGFVQAENFIEEVQSDVVIQYFVVESLKECLEENGYTILEKLPVIHKGISN